MLARALFAFALLGCLTGCSVQAPLQPAASAPTPPPEPAPAPEFGKASYYAPHFTGRTMASGKRFDPGAHVAAHRSLPFGSAARVTNLETGRSAIVRVLDRGPFLPGRVIDVSPAVAGKLGMRQRGVALVAVQPLNQAKAEALLAELAEAEQDAGYLAPVSLPR